MLSISYSQCLADPTYCDTGKEGGSRLVKQFDVHPAEARPLAEIMPFVTVPEMLWCLRAVKESIRGEADEVAWNFIYGALSELRLFNLFDEIKSYVRQRVNGVLHSTLRRISLDDIQHRAAHACDDQQDAMYKTIIAALQENSPSQIAINVANGVISVKRFDGLAGQEERRQRAHLKELLRCS